MSAHEYKAEYSVEYDSAPMSMDVQAYLKNFLTKQMCRILLILFFRTLSNKDLALQMGISTSALGNILQRMKKSQIELFITNKEDKYLLYSLTPVAYAYVKDNLVEEETSQVRIIHFHDEETSDYIECTNALQKLQEVLPVDMTREFENFIGSYYVKVSEEKRAVLDHFISSLAKIHNEVNEEEFRGIMDKLDDALQRNILHCVSLYQSMIQLCEIYEKSWELAYDFVDSIIESKGTSISLKVLCGCKTMEAETVVGIGNSLWEIVNISKINNHSKDEFMNCWKMYVTDKQFMRYIAIGYEKRMNV